MTKKTLLLIIAFLGFAAWHIYEISILHNNIKQVRKEAWFDAHKQTDSDIITIKSCLEHLESRIDQYHGSHPDYPKGYPLWEAKEYTKKDPLIEYLIDKSL